MWGEIKCHSRNHVKEKQIHKCVLIITLIFTNIEKVVFWSS